MSAYITDNTTVWWIFSIIDAICKGVQSVIRNFPFTFYNFYRVESQLQDEAERENLANEEKDTDDYQLYLQIIEKEAIVLTQPNATEITVKLFTTYLRFEAGFWRKYLMNDPKFVDDEIRKNKIGKMISFNTKQRSIEDIADLLMKLCVKLEFIKIFQTRSEAYANKRNLQRNRDGTPQTEDDEFQGPSRYMGYHIELRGNQWVKLDTPEGSIITTPMSGSPNSFPVRATPQRRRVALRMPRRM